MKSQIQAAVLFYGKPIFKGEILECIDRIRKDKKTLFLRPLLAEEIEKGKVICA